jgi:hypothetical protein
VWCSKHLAVHLPLLKRLGVNVCQDQDCASTMHTGQLALTIEYIFFFGLCSLLTRHQVSVVPCCLLLPADPQEAGEGLLFLARQAAHLVQTSRRQPTAQHWRSTDNIAAVLAMQQPSQHRLCLAKENGALCLRATPPPQ